MKQISLKEILNKTDDVSLKSWLIEFAKEHPSVEEQLRNKFSPQQIKEPQLKDYPALIQEAFSSNPIQSGNSYHGWFDIGFDALEVREDLEAIVEDIDYFLKYENTKVAVQICKDMIEIISENWENQFDYDGDVQVMYDEAIDRLENLLKAGSLSMEEKEDLFEWYQAESPDNRHDGVGLNTDLSALQPYFTETPQMFQQNLSVLDQKIQQANDYDKERLTLQKIEIMEDADRGEDASKVIDQNLKWKRVREIKVNRLIREKKYKEAIKLVKQGVDQANKEGYRGTVADWKDKLLRIYLLQKEVSKILKTSEDLLYHGRDQATDEYYDILKSQTPKEEWPKTLDRILDSLTSDKRFWRFDRLRAKILIDNKKWKELFEQCKANGVEDIEDYERYLKPRFEAEIFQIYLDYVEEEATITAKKAYANVADTLRRMKKFKGGEKKVAALLEKYRKVYKRRTAMMRALQDL